MKPLTSRQQQVLDYIRDHLQEKGYPPTLREIAGRFGLSGPRAAVKHLEALQKKGRIRRDPGSSRGIEILALRGGPTQGNAVASVPIIGTVPAGPLDLAFEEEEGTLILDPAVAGEGTFLLRVRGESMTGDHILPGDLILVKKQDRALEGELVIVLVGEEVTLKRFRLDGERMTLLPSNPDHQPLVINGATEEIRILGTVKAVVRITGSGGLRR